MGGSVALRIVGKYFALHVQSAMEYRIAFLTQVGFMILNDALWLVLWTLLFGISGPVNGYGARETILLFGIACLTIGLTRVVFGNIEEIADLISEGNLDVFLSQPIDDLLHAMVGKSQFHAFGDFLFGLGIIVVLAPQHLLLGLLVSLLGTIAYVALQVMVECIAFWSSRPKNLTQSLRRLIITFAAWPIDAFGNPVRTALYLIPIAFIATVPYNTLVAYSWSAITLLAVVALALLASAILLWRIGVRRYESGNAVLMRG